MQTYYSPSELKFFEATGKLNDWVLSEYAALNTAITNDAAKGTTVTTTDFNRAAIKFIGYIV